MNIHKALYRSAVMIGIGAVAFTYSLGMANAQQVVDAPFAKFQEKYGAEWVEDDKVVD